MASPSPRLVANHPTDLNAVTPETFDRISRHGYEVAERTLLTYDAAHFEGRRA